jgi:aryl-alcohol dehydrogenase-like predicted oxidoreductase
MVTTRATFLRGLVGLAATAVAGRSHGHQAEGTMHTRQIPSSGESLPIVGVGTWRGFDVGADAGARAQLTGVLQALFDAGGTVIDSSPMYGSSEQVTGDLLAAMGRHDRAFVATKVWTTGRAAGIRQMETSMRLLRDDRIELLQVHNLQDWEAHLDTLQGWKRDGRIQYLGVTHYQDAAHDRLVDVMRREPLDFVQCNYSIDNRAAEGRLLPLAADRGVAVLVNLPFGGGGLLRRVSSRPLPSWAGEIGCRTWAQVLLKFILGHPAVTCVIPGTSRPDHMRENAAAGIGELPDAAMRERMAASVRA